MVALKLILQTLAAVVAVGGTIGGTVALTNSKESNQDTNDFYLVSAAVDIADKKPSTDLFTNENLEAKNYQCINKYITTERNETITKDISCLLYSLNATKNTFLKTSEIQAFIKNTNQTSDLATKAIKKSEIKYQKFFLLQTNKSWITNTKSFIYLTKTETTNFFEQENYYVMLQVHAKISSNKITGRTDSIIAKATTNKEALKASVGTSTKTYKCSFKTNELKKECEISKLSQHTNANSFNFSNSEIKNKDEQSNIEKDNYYLIQWNEISNYELKDLKNKKTIYVEKEQQNPSSTTPLIVETVVFVKINNNNTTLNELIILD